MTSFFFVPECLVFKGRAATTFVLMNMMFAGVSGLLSVLASDLNRVKLRLEPSKHREMVDWS